MRNGLTQHPTHGSNCIDLVLVSTVEMFWSKISNVLHSCIAQFVPRRYQSRKPFSYPMHIRRLLGLKKLWYSKDKVCYKHFARKYDMAVKEFILSQENNVLKKKSLSSFYSYVNSKLTTSQCIPPLIDSNDNLAVSNHDKCTVLNDYFASVFTCNSHGTYVVINLYQIVAYNIYVTDMLRIGCVCYRLCKMTYKVFSLT